MSSRRKEKDELPELLMRFETEDITIEQLHRLNELLTVPELGVEAVGFLDLSSGLRDAHSNDCLDSDGKSKHAVMAPAVISYPSAQGNREPSLQNSASWNYLPYALAILFLTNLVVGGLVWFTVSRNVADRVQPSEYLQEPSAARSAQVVAMTRCVWSPSENREPAIGRAIPTGEALELLQGIAELELFQGDSNRSRIRLEGPGSVYTGFDGLLNLDFGTLTADVSWYDGPYSIDTPVGEVVTSGSASIGIVVNDPQYEVHVFRGDVTIKSDLSGEPKAIVRLAEGEAASLEVVSETETTVTLFEASSVSFASARTMAFDRLDIGQNYRDAIKKSGPAIYWQFEESDGDVIANHGSLAGFNAYIDGAVTWRQFGKNRAAEFGLTGTVGNFVSRKTWPTEPLDSYTVEMWAKPSHFHNGVLSCLADPNRQLDGRYPYGFLVEFGGQLSEYSDDPQLCNVRFLHRPVPSNVRLGGTSATASGGYHARTWQHVVARKDGDVLQLIIDGRVVAHGTDAMPLAANLQVVIGQLYPNRPERPFIGQIDEVAIYERALGDEEIRRHYELAKPQGTFPNVGVLDGM